MRRCLPGIYEWSWFSTEKGYDFNGHYLVLGPERPERPERQERQERMIRVIIDPPPLPENDRDWLLRQGPVAAIILTNRDHVREAAACRALFGAKVLIHALDAPLVDVKPDATFQDGDVLPGGLKAIQMQDGKSPGESALFLEHPRVLILGDALIGVPAGALTMMPPEKFKDPARARAGLRVLRPYAADTILVGDGASLITGGSAALARALDGMA